jgi:mono/diheme cytochrome c family protein
MKRDGWKQMLMESWAFLAVAAIAFVAGLLIGDLGASPETKNVYISNASGEEASEPSGEETEAEAPEAESASGTSSSGAQLFTGVGCGGCHTLSAAGTTGTTGPNLTESLAPDDNTQGIEEMIIHPNDEVVEGYAPNVMPQNYGETLSQPEVQELAEYLVASSPAKPSS